MQLTSPAFKHGEPIPARYSCSGEDLSPPLAWSGAPAGTKSFALIMDDPDAPVGTWVHWVLYDLPPGFQKLSEGLPKNPSLANGAKHGACWGVDSFSREGYYGPCPPPGKAHRYFFRLYALDTLLNLKPKAPKNEVLSAMNGHVLAQAELMGQFQR